VLSDCHPLILALTALTVRFRLIEPGPFSKRHMTPVPRRRVHHSSRRVRIEECGYVAAQIIVWKTTKSASINPVSITQALVVAKHLSFRAAARALGFRQSAVSRHVRALEDRLGVSLFERHHQGVRVTNAGARFLQQAREALAQLDQASKIAETAGRGATGQLRIGILSSMGAGFLRELIQSFSERHPDVSIQIVEGASSEQISLVRKRRLDVAFLADASEAIDCDVAPLWNECLCCAAAEPSAQWRAGRRLAGSSQ
jgi:DNA-binding transcriptional ArsR family regulator